MGIVPRLVTHRVLSPFGALTTALLLRHGACSYPREEIIGRNCRFLQGPETDKTKVIGFLLCSSPRLVGCIPHPIVTMIGKLTGAPPHNDRLRRSETR